jgi:Cu/Zn superoxide dismutase
MTKAALGGVAGGALILAGTIAGTMGAGAATTYRYVDKLVDLSAGERPFDSTTGKVTIVENDDGRTTFSIKVTGIDIDAADQLFGAHLHTGSCLEGNGAAAGPHYNTQLYPAGSYATYSAIPVELKTANNEVWFDLVPSEEDGAASDQVTVDFVPVDLDGVMSIVIHAEPTVDGGTLSGMAGAREACFPLSVPQWIYTPAV